MLNLTYLTTLRERATSPRAVQQDGTSNNINTDGESDDTDQEAEAPVSEADLASSLEDLEDITQKARIAERQKHMTWCNRNLKMQMDRLSKIQELAAQGKLLPPVLCSC